MSIALRTWIDGMRADSLPADDRGLQYGDGLFETVLIRAGQPRFLAAHLQRLQSGCARLRIPFAGIDTLRDEIGAACAQAGALAILKIIVTRGSSRRRGYAPDGAETPRRVMSLYEATPPDVRLQEGVRLTWASGRLADNPLLAGLKHLSRIENVLASAEAREAEAFDAVLRGADGRLVSGAMTNLFLVHEERVLTPSVHLAGVAGVLRGIVLRECAALGIPAAEQILKPEDLSKSDEAFVTNARIGVVPVARVGEHGFRMTTLARRLATHIEALDA